MSDVVLTQCLTCGTLRTISARVASRTFLTCEGCGGARTAHRPFLDRDDWRERENLEIGQAVRDLQDLVQRVESIGFAKVLVEIGLPSSRNKFGPAPLEVRRYEDPDVAGCRYFVLVHPDQSVADKTTRVLRGARWVLEDQFDGPLCNDSAGLVFRGVYSDDPLRTASSTGHTPMRSSR